MFWKLWASLVALGRVVSKTLCFFGVFGFFKCFCWFLIGFIGFWLMFLCFCLEKLINTMCLLVYPKTNKHIVFIGF
jgi:hypothetical protein